MLEGAEQILQSKICSLTSEEKIDVGPAATYFLPYLGDYRDAAQRAFAGGQAKTTAKANGGCLGTTSRGRTHTAAILVG